MVEQQAPNMAPVVEIEVRLQDGSLVADPDELVLPRDKAPRVVIWRAHSSIQEITDVSFKDNPLGQITTPVGAGPIWVCVDRCTVAGQWNYSISATLNDGYGVVLDPMIRNQ